MRKPALGLTGLFLVDLLHHLDLGSRLLLFQHSYAIGENTMRPALSDNSITKINELLSHWIVLRRCLLRRLLFGITRKDHEQCRKSNDAEYNIVEIAAHISLT